MEQAHYTLTAARLPGRLDAEAAAVLLGFKVQDIPVLVGQKLLKPLGKPAARNAKWFATVHLLTLCTDAAWLDKATKAIYESWRERNGRKAIEPSLAIPAEEAE